MNARQILSAMGWCVLFVFLAILGWELGLEDGVYAYFLAGDEHHAEFYRWESIVEVTVAVALVVAILGGLYIRAARAQERSERELGAILDRIQDTLYRTDLEGRIVMASPSAENLLGYTPVDVIGRQMADFYIDPKDRERFLTELQGSGGAVTGFQAAMRHRDGREVWVSTNAHYYLDESGEIAGIEGTAREITDRKKAERALIDVQTQLVDAIESVDNAFAIYDAEDRLVRCNEAYRRMFDVIADLLEPGVTFGEHSRASAERGLVLFEAPIEEWVRGRVSSHQAAIGGQEVRFTDGRWILAREHRMSNGGIVSIREDITAQKEAARLLAESDRQLREAQRIGQIGHWTRRIADGELTTSEEFRRIFDFEPGESVTFEALLGTYHEDDKAKMLETRQSAEAEERGYDYVFRIRRRDGEIRHIEGMAEPVRDDDGGLTGFFGVTQDVTERKQIEERLQFSENRLKEAAELANLGYWIWDAVEDKSLYCSEQCAEIHGLTPAQYIERASTIDGDFAMSPPEDRAEVKKHFQALRRGEEIELEYRILRPNGEVRFIHEIAKPIFDDAGNVVQEYGTILDITELRRSEEQLRQAQKMEAIGQLTGGIAHDFNNLLAIIQGNIAYLDRKVGADSDLKSLTEPALRAVERGASLTQRLLAFSRQQALEVVTVDAARLVLDLVEMLKRSLGETISVVIEAAPELWPCEADAGQLEQAIVNLANNARDAMPEGGELSIELANASLTADDTGRPAAGDYVVIRVADTGAGMAPEIREKIFEPFFTTKDVGRGTGLGLSMVYGFITQSGGHITVESEPGLGTSFALYLPRTVAAEAQPDAQIPMSPCKVASETVLVVEDEDDLRVITRLLLADLGYQVLEAASGEEALSLLGSTDGIDLLLTDVVLTGAMNGPEIAAAACAADPGLRVAYMSGYLGEALADYAHFADDTVLIQKPFDREDLASHLRQALDTQVLETQALDSK